LVNGKSNILRVPGWTGAGPTKAAWERKGVWTNVGTRTPFHGEMRNGTNPKVIHFQIRPDPLADDSNANKTGLYGCILGFEEPVSPSFPPFLPLPLERNYGPGQLTGGILAVAGKAKSKSSIIPLDP
jgi:hypothetical protein